jgi:hypothetical protein
MSGPGGGGGAAARAAEAAAHLGGQLACWEQVRRRALGAAAAGGERIEGCGMPGAAVGILRAGAQRPAPNGLAVPAPGAGFDRARNGVSSPDATARAAATRSHRLPVWPLAGLAAPFKSPALPQPYAPPRSVLLEAAQALAPH